MFFPPLSSIKDAIACLAPSLCISCGYPLVRESEVFCIACHKELPVTNFHRLASNPFVDKFYGRINLTAGASFLYFSKKGIAQNIIHQLKYRGKSRLGEHIGQLYGEYLVDNPVFQNVDMIVPVPLHRKRRKKRGYNQSEVFAKGLGKSMKITLRKDIILRTRATTTQTRKSRIERFENVEGAFEVQDSSAIQGKHILLVDDVLTTGATLEGCAKELLKFPGVKISMATIGFAYFQ